MEWHRNQEAYGYMVRSMYEVGRGTLSGRGGVLRRILIICAVAGCCLVGKSAKGAAISYSSFQGTVINFDDLAGSAILGNGEVLGNQYARQGVTFSVPHFAAYATSGILATTSAFTSAPNVIWVNQGGGNGGSLAQGLDIEFSTPQSKVGVYVEGSSNSFSTSTFTLAVYSGDKLLESLTSGLAPGGAVGLEGYLVLQDANITRAVIYSTRSDGQNWNFEVDNLKFSDTIATPEPAAFLLAGGGLALITIYRLLPHLRSAGLRNGGRNG